MKAITKLLGRLPGWAAVMVATTLLGHASPTWAQALCSPACGPGQICVQGICMVPAPAPSPPAYPPPPQAQPQTQYQPPAGYQQFPPPPSYSSPPPPAGYPQAAPPASQAYPPAQPGTYPPPPANVYSPPPSGVYPPPPGSYPPPPPAGLARRHGFLALPFIGIHSFQGDTGDNRGVGFRLGTLLGGRLSESLSLNGELTIDVANLESSPTGVDQSLVETDVAFSPLYHFATGNLEVVAGPKLGFWVGDAETTGGGITTKSEGDGFVLGVNAGLFAAISNSLSLGGLVGFEFRTVSKICYTDQFGVKICSTDSRDTGPSQKVLSLTGGVLF